ncbi:MAG: alpha-L-arabinofuranosidase C-terminal domain-containing protein [Bacteroidota bacterium]|nr:alpha-L-arabinofuranosidase C-terminal domain-containing protein [Bacteroidota bacterium]
MRLKFILFTAILAGLSYFTNLPAQQIQPVEVKVDQPKADIQPTMWGIFFEDINFAADGGIYAELVKNRSFEFLQPLMGWKELKEGKNPGNVLIVNRSETNSANPRFARITLNEGQGSYGLSNEGFRGMGVKKDNQYNFSLLASEGENSNIKLHLELVNANGEPIGSASLSPEGNTWNKYSVSFTATATEPKARLNIWFEGKGTLDIDMVSLFPNDTWKNRPNGLRADLVQLLADLKPGFIRFPGGCIVEGRDLANRYQWKNTIGNIDGRKLIINRWNTEFSHRSTPDYFQSFGLGFFEYFQLAEDIGAEPLPILNCGMACQYNTAEVASLEQLDPFIQDALDLIEFANGATTTKWGRLRAEMGHPAPFNLKFLGVGNEQWGPQYVDRYKLFQRALKEKYPGIKLVSAAGPSPDGDMFKYLWKELGKLNADIMDEHYYQSPSWFQQNVTRYDNYDRKGPKVFAGEYAAQSVAMASPQSKNTWNCALSEAAFMTGLERNADVVCMASYAPLFAHVDAWQWTPDLIWFDNLRSVGSADYYVQKLFSNNKGTEVLPMLSQGKPLTGQDGIYATAAFDKNSNEVILKVVNVTDKVQTSRVTLESTKKVASRGRFIVLKNSDLNAINSLDNPKLISPVEQSLDIKGKKINLTVDPYSVNVIRVKLL